MAISDLASPNHQNRHFLRKTPLLEALYWSTNRFLSNLLLFWWYPGSILNSGAIFINYYQGCAFKYEQMWLLKLKKPCQGPLLFPQKGLLPRRFPKLPGRWKNGTIFFPLWPCRINKTSFLRTLCKVNLFFYLMCYVRTPKILPKPLSLERKIKHPYFGTLHSIPWTKSQTS